MSVRTPAQLPPSHYIRFVRMATDGARAHTHLALVKNGKGAVRRAYVKHFYTNTTRCMLNEWVGYIVMSALGVPQPEAAVMQAPVPHKNIMAWAFVSFEPTPASHGTPKEVYNLYDGAQLPRLRARLWSSRAFPTLVAADQLCMNGDRNLGNLVFTGKHEFVAIDHSDILGGHSWTRDALLRPTAWVESVLLQWCNMVETLQPHECTVVGAAADVACEALYLHWMALRDALQSDADTQLALDAIWWRSLTLASWFRKRLHLLV